MRRITYPFVFATLMTATVGWMSVAANPPSHQAHRPVQTILRHVLILDGSGHLARVFKPGATIEFRVQWTVRNAPSHTRQTVEWTVLYSGHVILHLAKLSNARNGTWTRTATVSVGANPHFGTHVLRARVTVGHVMATRSVTFFVLQ